MKKLFGKVLVGAVGFVMALGMTAFAANEITNIQITPDPETGKVVISGQITGDAVSPESTILVAPENTSLAEVKDDNIRYIDQQTAASGKFNYEFTLDKGNVYNVWFGATDIAAAKEAQLIDLTGKTTGTFSIIGKVSLKVNDSDKTADITKVTASIEGKDPVKVDKTSGEFTLKVEKGNYDVVIGRAGYLYRTIKAEVVDHDVTLPETALVPGNVSDEGTSKDVIDSDDLSAVLAAYRAAKGDAAYNENVDFNDSGLIDSDDLTAILSGYRMKAADAYAAE